MEQGPSRLCPNCGTPRVGNFRWCRSCQFDYDADRVSAPPAAAPEPTPPPASEPAFTLPDVTPTASASPAVGPAPAPSAAAPTTSATTAPPPTRPSALSRIPPRARLPLTVAGVVAVVLGLALILIPPRQDSPVAVASPSGSGAATTPAPTQAAAPTPFTTISLSGTGNEDLEFSIPDGSSALATIINDGAGAFSVWTVAADGTRNEQLVNGTGPFAGTLLFDEDGRSTAFSVESDGNWSIEIKPISAARTWDLSERLIGDGSDVISVIPPTSADIAATLRYDGASNVSISAHAASGKVQLLNAIGPLDQPLGLPSGTSLIEIEADDAWSIAPE